MSLEKGKRRSQFDKFISDKPEGFEKEFVENIKKLYLEDNLTLVEIAAKLDLDSVIVRGVLKKYNIKKLKDLHYQRVTEKAQKTNLEKYGVTCSLHSEEGSKKSKETWMKNYGVDNPSKDPGVKAKIFRNKNYNPDKNMEE